MESDSRNAIAQGNAMPAGRWSHVLIILTVRSFLALAAQMVVSLVLGGDGTLWEAGVWWRVYGTLIDIGSLVALVWVARREGFRLLDLGRYADKVWWLDVLIGLALFVPVFILTMFLPQIGIAALIYGGPAPYEAPPLSLACLLYSLVVWPIIWAFVEDNVYFGYGLPAIVNLTGRRSTAVVLVVGFASLQHGFLPLAPDWRHFAFRCVASAPVILALCWLTFRQRRLLPIHVIHWLGNVVGILMLMMTPPA